LIARNEVLDQEKRDLQIKLLQISELQGKDDKGQREK
jgi:hypothetical protein